MRNRQWYMLCTFCQSCIFFFQFPIFNHYMAYHQKHLQAPIIFFIGVIAPITAKKNFHGLTGKKNCTT